MRLHPDNLRELVDALRRPRTAAEWPLWLLIAILTAALLLK
jgi:hypothetical protein